MGDRKIKCPNCHQDALLQPGATRQSCNRCRKHENQGVDDSCFPKGCLQPFLNMCSSSATSGSEATSQRIVDWPNPIYPPSSGHQPKKALICGVSYIGQKFRLKGTINDVRQMTSLLIGKYKFPAQAICVLTENDDSHLRPTRTNIEEALRWLVSDCQSGDSLVFYFSGHGLRQPDFDDDELDGFNETLCPMDYSRNGMILDNDINTTIVKPLMPGVHLHAIIDSCHSGTVLDLEYLYDRESRQWQSNKPPSGVNKNTSGGLAICLSACADNEFAADTNALSGEMSGAMTYFFTEAIKKNPGMTYGQLLDEMIFEIGEANKAAGFLKWLLRTKSIKKPLLSSSKEFDVDTTKFSL
ncbi:hypothetical protein NMG60_11022024 [Bertholletia excelsa]